MLRFDFAILLVAPDDTVVSRRKRQSAPRDNVLFEFGMFMAVLGRRRTFLLVEERLGKQPKIPSDVFGIKALSYELPAGVDLGRRRDLPRVTKAVRHACEQLRRHIAERYREWEAYPRPSTVLGLGYFHNFVLHACRGLLRTPRVAIGEQMRDLAPDCFDFVVVLPDDLTDSSHQAVKRRVEGLHLHPVVIHEQERSFPFFAKVREQDGRVQFFDFPTTLLSANEAIKQLLGSGASPQERQRLQRREVENFALTLEQQLADHPDAQEFQDNVRVLRAGDRLPRRPAKVRGGGVL